MKSYIVALLAISSPAIAQDLTAQKVAADASTQETKPLSWSGPYVGVQLGYSLGDVAFVMSKDNRIINESNDNSLNQGLTGFKAGYDWQSAKAVIGVVAEANVRFGKASFDASNLPATPFAWETSSKWDAGLRIRVGILAQDNLLLYATGGLAAASFVLKNTETPTASMWGDANVLGGTNVGWSSGVGIEYRLNSPWSAQIEYLHSDFGNETVYLDVSDIIPKLLSNSIKVGVNYRF